MTFGFIEMGALIVDPVGVALMVIGFVMALFAFLRALTGINTTQHIQAIQIIRCKLGVYIALGLELMIGSDFLRTIVKHTAGSLRPWSPGSHSYTDWLLPKQGNRLNGTLAKGVRRRIQNRDGNESQNPVGPSRHR